jgi:hypothetical protein
MRWFRFYDSALDDPKVQTLEPTLFKAWVNLLCVSSKHDGILPSVHDLAFMLRKTDKEVIRLLDQLIAARLIDDIGSGILVPHNWNGRQHRSDTSNDRVKRHRERKRNGECNVTSTVAETPPDTDTDTDTDPSPAARASIDAWLRGLVASEPVLLDLDTSPITRLLDDGYTVEDVERGIAAAMAKTDFRPAYWSQLVGWVRKAAKTRLAGQPKGAHAAPEPPKHERTPETWEHYVRRWQRTHGEWLANDGFPPDHPETKVPREILVKCGVIQEAA